MIIYVVEYNFGSKETTSCIECVFKDTVDLVIGRLRDIGAVNIKVREVKHYDSDT